MSRQSKPINLRDREIAEILDEDKKFYRQVLDREFKQARLMNETYAPPNQQEKQVAFQIDRYFTKLQQEADIITNGFANDIIEDPSALISAYQELIGYLEVYAQYGSLNQRDISVIENKFDAIAPQIEQISTGANYMRWRQAPILEQLSGLLQDRHYIKLRKGAETISQRKAEPDMPAPPSPPEEPPVPPSSTKRARIADTPAPAEEAPATPKKKEKEELRDYMNNMSQEKLVQYVQQLNLYDKLKLKSGYISVPKMGVGEMRLVKALNTQGGEPASASAPTPSLSIKQEASPLPFLPSASSPLMEYGDPANVPPQSLANYYFGRDSPYRPEIQPQPDMSGEGRRRQLGIMCGAGESEDMMFGRPVGLKKALRLRPMDRRPVHYKSPDQVGEAGLTLEKRMMFLNQLDSKNIKDELEINSTSSYKKAMTEKLKKLAKMKGKE